MTLTRRARGAWPIVGAVFALAAAHTAPFEQLPQPPVQEARRDTGESSRVERRGQLVPPARVSGRIVASDGRPLQSGAVILTPAGSDGIPVPPEDVWIGPDGAF